MGERGGHAKRVLGVTLWRERSSAAVRLWRPRRPPAREQAPTRVDKAPLRIAYVIKSLEGAGTALPVPSIANVLRRNGADVRVFALTRADGRALPVLEAAGLDVRLRDGGNKDDAAAIRWLDQEFRQWRPTHVWTSLTRATLLGQILGLRYRLPVISWQHAAWLKPSNRLLLRATQPLTRLWIGDSAAVTALTRTRLRVPADRLTEWPIFCSDPHALQANPWQPGMTVRIGSLGRLHPVKGYDVLIDALALLPPLAVKIEVVVSGDGAERSKLEDRARSRGVPIQFAGYAEAPQRFLAGLHLYVQPSQSEGMCLAAHEAMQAGLPVIASAAGELPHTIIDGVNGYIVPPDDPHALANSLASLLRTPEALAQMGAAAREQVLARFGPERFDAAGKAILTRMRAMA